jgi:signal transduction histidine kinase
MGGAAIGLGVIMVGARSAIPPWVSFIVGNSLIVVGNLMHVLALGKEVKGPMRWLTFVGIYLVSMLTSSYLHLVVQNPEWRFGWNLLSAGLLTGWTAWLAWMIGRNERSKSAYWLAVFYGLLMLEMSSRGLLTWLGWSHSTILDKSFENVRLVVSVLMSGVLGNIMVIGLYLERAGSKNIRFAIETERQNLNARLGEKITELFRERSLDEVSISLAHELGQPITGILFDGNMVKMSCIKLGIDSPEVTAYLSSLETHALRARAIIEAISRFVKSDEIAFETVDIHSVLDDVKQLLALAVNDGKIQIEIESLLDSALIRGNRVLLSLVFHNLLRNAMQACGAEKMSKVRLTLTRQDAQLSVRVEDNGPGFSQEALRLTGDQRFTTKSDGMGVGLALCRRIAKQHNGSMTLSNRETGQGAVVLLTFPLLKDTPTRAPLGHMEQ